MRVSEELAATGDERHKAFTQFARDAEPRLRFALAAAIGQDMGREAAAEALAYGWEHWNRVRDMANPVGYLYRVGRSRVKRPRRLHLAPVPATHIPHVEPALPAALAKLSDRQRVTVVLVHGFDWTHEEVASMLGVETPTIATHLRRALSKLRRSLKVETDA